MAVGTIVTSILTDIANAIRYQAGVATLYQPRQMAAAVAALDGTNQGNYHEESYKQLERGILAQDVFGDIADAIRGQNGSQMQYLPEEMAGAILALSWDTGLKGRALLLDDGTFELNYLNSRQTTRPGRSIVQAFEVDVNGYANESSRPWDANAVRNAVKTVFVDSSFAGFGLTNFDYFFKDLTRLEEVYGFENLTGITKAYMGFGGCSVLRSIFATSFTNNISTGAYMFNGCNCLVGGADGKCISTTSMGPNLCKLGTGGLLTDPNNDSRVWYNSFLYSDYSLVLSVSAVPDPNKTLLVSRPICANASYKSGGFRCYTSYDHNILTADFASDMGGLSFLNLMYLFENLDHMTSVSGLGYLSSVRSLYMTFSSCKALVTLDFRGFDPSHLTDLFMTFNTCDLLTTIYADATWALPASGVSGSSTFGSCGSLVGVMGRPGLATRRGIST